MRFTLLKVFTAATLLTPSSWAQDKVAADPELKRINDRIDELQDELDSLKKQKDERFAIVERKIAEEDGRPVITKDDPLPGLNTAGEGFKKFAKENRLTIRQSVLDKAGKTEAAKFQYSMPSSDSDSWSGDVGISIEKEIYDNSGVGFLSKIDRRFMAEAHYNDEGDSEKNSYFVGGGLDFWLGADTERVQKTYFDIGYKRDELVAGDALLGTFNWLPSYHEWGIGDYWNDFGLIGLRIAPLVGIEAEFGDGGTKNAFTKTKVPDGDRLSFRAGATLTGLILPETFGNRLETSFSGSWWVHPNLSGAFNAYSEHQFAFSGSVTYWLDSASTPGGSLAESDKHFGLSAKYLNGDNPLTGELDQNIWTFGLSAKY
jgi:hypothetical protein